MSSMLFGAVIGTAYALTTHDIVGTMLLGMMSAAFLIMGGYVAIAERRVRLRSDDESSGPTAGAGDVIGSFALESYWPPLAALGLAVVIAGIAFAPGLSVGVLAFSIGASFLVLRLLMREST